MYGSVSRWRVKNGRQQELEGLFTEMMKDLPPGSRGRVVRWALRHASSAANSALNGRGL